MSEKVVWSSDGVKLHSPSSEDYQKVIEHLRKTNNGTETLWRFDLYKTQIAQSIIQLNAIRHLVSLGLFQCTIDPRSFSEAISSNRTLNTLWLDKTPLTLLGLQQLYPALSANKTLKTLWLTHDVSINDRTAVYIAQILGINRTLRNISLFECDMGDDGAGTLMESLRINTALASLNISGNRRITSSSATNICQMIKSNSSLEELQLCDTSLTESGVTRICQALLYSGCPHRKVTLSEPHKSHCVQSSDYFKIKDKLVFV